MYEVAAPESLWLPPFDARLIDPRQDKLETPVDERGLIMVPELIDLVKSTVDPAYEWPSGLSVHHLYWPMAWYAYDKDPEAIGDPGTFRNLPINKALLPRVFENWLHTITLAPDIPDPEVMQYRIEAWNIAKDLFKMARGTVVHEKRTRRRRENVATGSVMPNTEDDRIGEEWMEEEFDKYFRGWEYQRERHDRLPREFRLLEIDGPPEIAARELGKIVMPRSLQLVRAAAVRV